MLDSKENASHQLPWPIPIYFSVYKAFILGDHPFKTSACVGSVSPCADGQKVAVHKDQKSPL